MTASTGRTVTARRLFGDVLLVPGGSADRAFYVRNGASEPAVLRVTLYDVTTTDTDFAAALTVTTSLPGRPGTSVPVTDARPCATLSQGQVLAAGDGIRLDNVAALADLNGTGGQSERGLIQARDQSEQHGSGGSRPEHLPDRLRRHAWSAPPTRVPAGAPRTRSITSVPAAGPQHRRPGLTR